MLKLNFTKKLILNVALLSIAILIIVFLIILPTMQYIKMTTEETYRLRVYLEEKFQQAKSARITKNRLGELQTTVEGFALHLFKRGEELKLITHLETLASRHKLAQSIRSSNLDNITDNKIIISIDLSGAYRDALRYISDIEASPYFINLERIQLNPVFDRSGSVVDSVMLSITMELYAQ